MVVRRLRRLAAMTLPDSTDTLIVPFAITDDEACRPVLDQCDLPHLRVLFGHWHPGPIQQVGAYRLNTPHEHALAEAQGWATRPDGALPLAAHAAGLTERACAWFHPCHWNVGMEQVSLQSADGLDVTEAESQALLQALQPLAEEDGLALFYEEPGRWRAEGPVFRDLPWASLDRVAYRRIDGWLPDAGLTPAARPLLRLQNEAQMLFYTHRVNDERAAKGLASVNGFWISGCGQLEATERGGANVQVETSLRQPALQGHWTDWARAWQALDANVISSWLGRAERGDRLTLVLCGERGWRSWTSQPLQGERPRSNKVPWWRRWWKGSATPTSVAGILEGL